MMISLQLKHCPFTKPIKMNSGQLLGRGEIEKFNGLNELILIVPLFVHCSVVLEILAKEGVVSRRQDTMATRTGLGTSGFGFQRFKKSWRD